MDAANEHLPESGAVSLSDKQWVEARRRAAIIGPLADSANISQRDVEDAARGLGLSGRTVYRLLRVWRRTGGSVPTLAPATPIDSDGKIRLGTAIEAIIDDAVIGHYLQRQKPLMSAVVKEIRRRCRLSGFKAPVFNTVKARIDRLRPDKVASKREGSKAAHRFKPAPGTTPPAQAPLKLRH